MGVLGIVKTIVGVIVKHEKKKVLLAAKAEPLKAVVTDPYVFNPLKHYGKPVSEHSKDYLSDMIADMPSMRGFELHDLKSLINNTHDLQGLSKIAAYITDAKKTYNLNSSQLIDLHKALIAKVKAYEEHELLLKLKHIITEYGSDLF